jgi:hypothetical protein
MYRELKTDFELACDVRYYNKYGDFLVKRIEERNFYERLDLQRDCSEGDIKAAYRAKALIWHPDNIRYIFGVSLFPEKITELVLQTKLSIK